MLLSKIEVTDLVSECTYKLMKFDYLCRIEANEIKYECKLN